MARQILSWAESYHTPWISGLTSIKTKLYHPAVYCIRQHLIVWRPAPRFRFFGYGIDFQRTYQTNLPPPGRRTKHRGTHMATNTVTNWFGNIVSHPSVIVEAHSVDDIVAVMKDPAKYPSPVRAVGSNHSTAPCGVADGGTLILMRMNRILNIGTDTLTVEADAVHRDMAKALEAKQL